MLVERSLKQLLQYSQLACTLMSFLESSHFISLYFKREEKSSYMQQKISLGNVYNKKMRYFKCNIIVRDFLVCPHCLSTGKSILPQGCTLKMLHPFNNKLINTMAATSKTHAIEWDHVNILSLSYEVNTRF